MLKLMTVLNLLYLHILAEINNFNLVTCNVMAPHYEKYVVRANTLDSKINETLRKL